MGPAGVELMLQRGSQEVVRMKLIARSRTSARRLRQSVDSAGGSVEMRVSAIMRPLKLSSPTAVAVEQAEAVLKDAGLYVDGGLAGHAWDDIVAVRAIAGAPAPQPVAEQLDET